jgi:hypothetical protein
MIGSGRMTDTMQIVGLHFLTTASLSEKSASIVKAPQR